MKNSIRKERTKILHISRRFLPCRGGTEKYIRNIAIGLSCRGYESRVLCLDTCLGDSFEKLPSFEIIDGIAVRRIRGIGPMQKPVPLELPIDEFKRSDIVIVHDTRFLFETAVVLKKIFKYKLVYVTHGFILHTNKLISIKNMLIKYYYSKIFSNCFDSIVCVSLQDYEFFSKKHIPRLHFIENGIDTKQYINVISTPEKNRILFFGRLCENKGIDFLLRALSIMKEQKWELYIAGTGSAEYICYLRQLAVSLGIENSIRWLGAISDEDLREQLAKSAICVFPSLYEGFGFTLVEAMAAGALCVANDIPTYRDILKNGDCGKLVNVKDISSFKSVLKSSLNMTKEESQYMRTRARLRAQEYDLRQCFEKIDFLLKALY